MPKYQAQYNFSPVAQGDTVREKQFVFTMPSGVTITGASVRFRDKDGTIIYTEDPMTVTGGLTVTLSEIPDTTTDSWETGDLEYDIKITRSDGIVRHYLSGILPIVESIT